MKILSLFCLLLINISFLTSQDVIEIKNPSFEGEATQGGIEREWELEFWWDCGFKGQTPPDIHSSNKGFFGVSAQPKHGKTFLGLVTRENNTYECVSQNIENPLQKHMTYIIQMALCRSDIYKSQLSNYRNNDNNNDKLYNLIKPIVVQIWGGNENNDQLELLAESLPIKNTAWSTYEFNLKPTFNQSLIEIRAYYAPLTNEPYNGNVLIDNLSDIYRID